MEICAELRILHGSARIMLFSCQTGDMMQRPVLNPSFLDDPDFDLPKPRRRPWRVVWTGVRAIGRLLLWQPFYHRAVHPEDPEIPLSWKKCVGILLRRMVFVPIALTLIIGALVYRGTHPMTYETGETPANMGIYYEPVAMRAVDGQRLEGWLIPAIHAQMVVEQQDAILRQQRAAVVLVHDHEATRAQMLPLVRPLHEAGLIVLVVGVRGEGTRYAASRTFGLREALDVHASVQMLRRRPFVDPTRIAVIGSGSGATAALLAAAEDPAIAALVLDSPVTYPDQVLSTIGPEHAWLAWLRVMCKWAFEFSHAVDADDLDLSRHRQVLNRVPILMLDESNQTVGMWTPQRADHVITFLKQHLKSDTTRQIAVGDIGDLSSTRPPTDTKRPLTLKAYPVTGEVPVPLPAAGEAG